VNEKEVRAHVKQMYPLSLKWAARVDKMPIEQVFAIHRRQCQIEDEERELQEKKQDMRAALLEEGSPEKMEEFLQASLF
jgi:hypothetical protein